MDEERRATRWARGASLAAVTTLALGAGVCGIVSGVSEHRYGDRVQAADATQTRNDFWSSLDEGGLRGDGSVQELSRSLSGILTNGRLDRGVLSPGDVRDVFVAPGVLDGVNDAFGREVLAGITTRGEDGDEDSSSTSSMACEDCGHFTDAFIADAERAASGDVAALIEDTPAVGEAPSHDYLLVAAPGTWGLAMVLGVLVGWARSRGDYYDRRRPLVRLDVRRAGAWSKRWAAVTLPVVVVPWLIALDVKDVRARRAAWRRQEQAKAQAREAVLARPAGEELLAAQENLARLEALPEDAEVRRAKDLTRELIKELGGTSEVLDEMAARRVVAEVLDANEAIRIRKDSLVAGHEEVFGGGR